MPKFILLLSAADWAQRHGKATANKKNIAGHIGLDLGRLVVLIAVFLLKNTPIGGFG
jgi:hypothetical protein